MKINELNKGDESILQALKDREYPALDKEHYGDDQPDFEEKEFILIAKEQELIAGFIKIIIRFNIAYIDSLLVGNDFRGKGYGKELVKTAELKAKENGAHKIWFETGLTWKAKSFYEKLGYTVRTILPNDVGHQEFVLMDKML